MPFLSTILSKPVTDMDGREVGRIEDLIAAVTGEATPPQVVAIAVHGAGAQRLIPFSEVVALVAPAIPLAHRIEDIAPFAPGDQHMHLVRDVLDKQLIDTNGIRVVRVNDLELARVNGLFYVANVDIGGMGLLRRLGLEWLGRLFGRKSHSPGAVISWQDVELLPGHDNVRLRVPSDKIGDLHPADLAEIISDLSRQESSALLETLDIKTVADALEEVEPDFQAQLVEAMTDDRLADVLEEMAPDEAADLVAELPEDRKMEVLRLMEVEEARDVRRLMDYPPDSAGGIMTTEYVAVGPNLTAAQAISVLRETAHDAETINCVYVIDSDHSLLGVFSLRELVMADPELPTSEFMHRRVVSVHAMDSQDEVAQAVSKYNLQAVPVVDDDFRLQGLVTADDALDKIIPTGWKKRLPRFYH